MKKTPWLDLYKKWTRTGKMTPKSNKYYYGGLCSAVPLKLQKGIIWNLVKAQHGDNLNSASLCGYWASSSCNEEVHDFGPLRQTIILLCACLNDEL